MDYACGSAHFLTEIIEELQEDLKACEREEGDNTTWTRDYVWGIEKNYRLARTAKIAMFLHGAGDANILHEDGLDHANPTLPPLGTLDVLIANPPYSIARFKEHLRLQANRFDLLPSLTNASSEIETLFVERAAQLLKVGGIAGLILPSSILSNAGIYQRTCALLLKKFLIRGIVEMGGSAFIATGTNTVILFLERRPDTDEEHFGIRADALFNEDKQPNDEDFADSDLLDAYTTAAGLDFTDYCAWLADPAGEPSEALAQTPLFSTYASEFASLTTKRANRGQKSFQNLSEAEQEVEMQDKFLVYLREAERKKFFYFALAYVQRLESGELIHQSTTIVRGAGGKPEEQAFLGYKWSQRRGAEGMVFLREPYDGGMLYTPEAPKNPEAKDCAESPEKTPEAENRAESPEKAAHHLRAAFLGADPADIPDDCPLAGKLRIAPTPAYFDFTRTSVDLSINLSPKESGAIPVFETQYELVPLGQIAKVEQGQSPPSSAYNNQGEGLLFFQGSKDFGEFELKHSGVWTKEVTRKAIKGDLLMSVRAPVGNLNDNPFDEICIGRGLAKLTPSNALAPKYFFCCLLFQKDQITGHKNIGFSSISKREIEEIKIPLPPLPVQQRIVEEIEKVEAAEAKARNVITDAEQAIESILLRIMDEKYQLVPLCELAKVNPPKITEGLDDSTIISFIEMASVSDKGYLITVEEKSYKEVRTGYTNFVQGDVLLAKITPCMENGKIAYLESLPHKIGFGSTEFFVIRANNEYTAKIIYYCLNREGFRQLAARVMTGASGHRRVPKNFLEQYKVPQMSIPDQQAVLAEIAEYEARKAAAEAELAAAPNKKRQILLDGLK
ncbi:MAG: N-6 DNA methylase [Cyanobacteriota bacterium]